MKLDPKAVRIRHYPDPVLRKKAADVKEFNADLAALAQRMFEIMRELNGVGLAAPQVGVSIRMFVMNPTGEPQDDLVIINPELSETEGNVEKEEGCLSLPGVNVQIKRSRRVRLVARDLRGDIIDRTADELVARVWQHETDHLNGVLIIDRMGPSDRIATKKILEALEAGSRK